MCTLTIITLLGSALGLGGGWNLLRRLRRGRIAVVRKASQCRGPTKRLVLG